MSAPARTKIVLDESRTMMLGTQILFGFQLETPFQATFAHFTEAQRYVTVGSLVLTVITISLLIAPGARHRIVENGEAKGEFNRFVSRISLMSLAIFNAALACQLFIVVSRMAGSLFGVAAAVTAAAMGAIIWFGPYMWNPGVRRMPSKDEDAKPEEKVEFALTEARVVLPGAQALLGFQLIAVLTEPFDHLPFDLKLVHASALVCVVISTMLLLAPAAYHRLVFDGDCRPEFYPIATRYILFATCFLGVGIALDVFLVTQLSLANGAFAASTAFASLMLMLFFWYVWPMKARRARGG